MKTPTRSRSYQMGAAHERQAVAAYLRRRIAKLPMDPTRRYDLAKALEWVERRVSRFTARPGGLQGKRKKGAK